MTSATSSTPHADTPDSDQFDVAVIGAGVVGCAVARAFAIRGIRTVILEKAGDILEGASKGNSALLHTGFDEPPGSLELQMIHDGFATYHRIRERLNLPFVATGAHVVAWTEEDMDKLPDIAAHGLANGVPGLGVISREELLAREPHLNPAALGAVEVPGEGVIDPWSAPLAYMRQALLHGAQLVVNAEVRSVTRGRERWTIMTGAGVFSTRLVVNAAGLYGDKVEALAGRVAGFAIRPRKGQFLVYDKPAFDLVNSILLRVPTERTKGVLIAPTVFGNLLVGPTAEDQDDRVHARVDANVLRRIMAEGEIMVPGLAGQTITATFAGLRPATEFRDFILRTDAEAGWITLGGIRSTGLSASLGLGAWAAEQGARLLGANSPVPPDEDLDWPTMPNIASSARRSFESGNRSQIVCHCEWVTEGEVIDALTGPVPAGTLGGLKRRTRVMMGRCQGFGCSGAVRRLAPDLLQAQLSPSDAAE
ncbi:MAG: NAD(P)/FAD-dependent oxidoreductase [Devosia sp.]|nr:NAD(P)/FAD-dependent oxidoreductase [Devosia sp.]